MDPATLTIRDYTPEDGAALMALWGSLGLGGAHRGDTPEVIAATLACGGRLLVLVTPQGERVGSAWITHDGRRLHLHHVGVAAAWQGQGLGRRLTEAALAVAQARHLQIKLEVGRSNTRAQALYRGLGFEPLGDYDVLIDRRPGLDAP